MIDLYTYLILGRQVSVLKLGDFSMVNCRILGQPNGVFIVEVLYGKRILSFQELMTCSLVQTIRCFLSTYCLLLQG